MSSVPVSFDMIFEKTPTFTLPLIAHLLQMFLLAKENMYIFVPFSYVQISNHLEKTFLLWRSDDFAQWHQRPLQQLSKAVRVFISNCFSCSAKTLCWCNSILNCNCFCIYNYRDDFAIHALHKSIVIDNSTSILEWTLSRYLLGYWLVNC